MFYGGRDRQLNVCCLFRVSSYSALLMVGRCAVFAWLVWQKTAFACACLPHISAGDEVRFASSLSDVQQLYHGDEAASWPWPLSKQDDKDKVFFLVQCLS